MRRCCGIHVPTIPAWAPFYGLQSKLFRLTPANTSHSCGCLRCKRSSARRVRMNVFNNHNLSANCSVKRKAVKMATTRSVVAYGIGYAGECDEIDGLTKNNRNRVSHRLCRIAQIPSISTFRSNEFSVLRSDKTRRSETIWIRCEGKRRLWKYKFLYADKNNDGEAFERQHSNICFLCFSQNRLVGFVGCDGLWSFPSPEFMVDEWHDFKKKKIIIRVIASRTNSRTQWV